MADFVEKEGPSVEEAVFSAARVLGIDPKDAQVQVLSAPGALRVRVRVARPGVPLPPAGSPSAAARPETGMARPAGPAGPPRQERPSEAAAQPPTRTPPGPDQAARAAEDLRRLLEVMGAPGEVEALERSGNVVLNVRSPLHENLLIGRRGQTVDALQTLINEFMGRREGDASLFVVVDVADYRGRQERKLVEKALALAAQVAEDGVQASMGPLS